MPGDNSPNSKSLRPEVRSTPARFRPSSQIMTLPKGLAEKLPDVYANA